MLRFMAADATKAARAGNTEEVQSAVDIDVAVAAMPPCEAKLPKENPPAARYHSLSNTFTTAMLCPAPLQGQAGSVAFLAHPFGVFLLVVKLAMLPYKTT